MKLVFDVSGVTRTIEPDNVVIAGFTGRDHDRVKAHLTELASLGIPTPDNVPVFYTVSTDLLTQDGVVVTEHPDTSGEVEVVLMVDSNETIVALGSDHTDRAAEASDIERSKRLCQKPISDEGWPLELVEDHLDELEIRSWIVERGVDVLYQSGRLGEILALGDLVDRASARCPDGSFVLFCGTVASIGGIRGSDSFRAELFDPKTQRTITLVYRVEM